MKGEYFLSLFGGVPLEEATMKFRKKPVVVEAMQWNGENAGVLTQWGAPVRFVGKPSDSTDNQLCVWAVKEQAWIPCPVGHWILRGIAGEYYPCDPDVFKATYEPIQVPASSAGDRVLTRARAGRGARLLDWQPWAARGGMGRGRVLEDPMTPPLDHAVT